jgi:hypothetical protein
MSHHTFLRILLDLLKVGLVVLVWLIIVILWSEHIRVH